MRKVKLWEVRTLASVPQCIGNGTEISAVRGLTLSLFILGYAMQLGLYLGIHLSVPGA